MRLIYEGRDITESVEIAACVYDQRSGGRSDSVEIRLNRAADWFRWKPQRNDRLAVRLDSLDSGAMFVNAMIPDDEGYRIVATAVPAGMQQRRWMSYAQRTLAGILAECAAECAMSASVYGMDGSTEIGYIIRDLEGAPAFAERLLRMEGGVLLAGNGRFNAVSIAHAQEKEAAHRLEIEPEQPGVFYVQRRAEKLASLTVLTPFGTGTAWDSAGERPGPVIGHLPACSDAQALRWARGLLLHHNRQTERLRVESEFNGLCAMDRVDVHSGTDMHGRWLVDNVRHDLIAGTSEMEMLRCVDSIG